MKLTRDEERALAFIAALLFLSAAVRLATLRDPVPAPASGLDFAAHIAASEAALDSAERADRPLAPGERLDLNRAAAADFTRLPRVGDALALRIVEDRQRNGPFESIEALTRVRGVGAATLERLAPHLEVRGGAAPARRARRPAAPAGAGPGGPAPADRILDLNTATVAELATLPGIGPTLAARIAAYRDSAGPFPAVDSLLAVRGVGPATLARLRRRLRVD